MSGLQEILNKCKAAIWSVTPWIGFISTSSWKLICSAIDEVAIIPKSAEPAPAPREDALAKLVMDLREMHGMTVCGEAWQELELDSEQMAAEIERYVESRQKTVPMEMLEEIYEANIDDDHEYGDPSLREIAARYGYKVEEDTP